MSTKEKNIATRHYWYLRSISCGRYVLKGVINFIERDKRRMSYQDNIVILNELNNHKFYES